MNNVSGSRLYVSDLDGTLLDSQGKLPESSVTRLNALLDQGLMFTVATARTLASALPVLKGIRFKLPLILFDGVFLTDIETRKNLAYSDFISKEIIQEFFQYLFENQVEPFAATYGPTPKLLIPSPGHPGMKAFKDHMGEFSWDLQDSLQALDDETHCGMVLIDKMETLYPIMKILRLKNHLELKVSFSPDAWNPDLAWMFLFPKSTSKGSMLKKMSSKLQFSGAQITVFGDNVNDLEMFEVADQAFAVSNARPELKNCADGIIASNDEGGVLDYLESEFTG